MQPVLRKHQQAEEEAPVEGKVPEEGKVLRLVPVPVFLAVISITRRSARNAKRITEARRSVA